MQEPAILFIRKFPFQFETSDKTSCILSVYFWQYEFF